MGRAERETVAGLKFASVQTAEAAQHIGRAAAEPFGHRNPAGQTDIGSCPATHSAQADAVAGMQGVSTPLHRRLSVDRTRDVRAGYCDQALARHLERRPGIGHFQPCGVLRVADQQIADPKREIIQRARRRHPDVVPVQTPQVLNGGQQAGLKDVQHERLLLAGV